ncbi:MAG: UDP-N-acetylmuramoyl-L-alanyl-D-glutamate--2,6-diaminopimelate ligase, partial [Omnitrophica WOR_2 bacterium]
MDSFVSLQKVFNRFPLPVLTPVPEDVMISGVTSDSRQVQPGSLFVAISGGNTDGHRYISDAVQRGAAAIAGEREIENLPVPYIRISNSRQGLAYLAAGFYDYPAHRMLMIGVTGTDGKTTTTNMIYEILREAGLKAGMISTINAVIGSELLDTGFHVTTPDAPDVQRYLAQMEAAGLTHVVLETTSHGWAQYRVDACEFDIGAVTNITHEHLDFHHTYEAYRAAKGRLFTGLAETPEKEGNPPRVAVLNRDDISYEYLAGVTNVRQIAYGLQPGADVKAENIRHEPGGLRFDADGPGFYFPVEMSLYGDFNVSNSLAAISVTAAGMGLDPEPIQAALAKLKGVPGRMERIELGQDFLAIVDFAHTPNALVNSLKAARLLAKNRVIAIFGAAGLRDRLKRRMMAEVSAEYADLTVLTAEDPRTESLDDILSEMAAGMLTKGGVEGQNFWRIPDRGEALR